MVVETKGEIDGDTLVVEFLEVFVENEVVTKGNSEVTAAGFLDRFPKGASGYAVEGVGSFAVGITSA